jgi:hypothetical protein
VRPESVLTIVYDGNCETISCITVPGVEKHDKFGSGVDLHRAMSTRVDCPLANSSAIEKLAVYAAKRAFIF